MTHYYLKKNIKMEPLIWAWYAWPHLIPPATAACNIVDRHLKILNSYLHAPDVHAEAVKNPKLMGGPFVDIDISYLNKVKELFDETIQHCKTLIKLADDLKAFDRLLQVKAQGDNLETLYQHVPDSLRGMIEIVYDLNNNCSIRLIEPLFYQKYYSHQHQVIALSKIEGDERSFVMSTPRIEKDNEVYLKIPFSDEKIDTLFSMRHTTQNFDKICEMLEVNPDKRDLFATFFSETNMHIDDTKNYKGEQVRLRYFGHACILIQNKNISILVDPVISYNVDSSIERYTFDNLPDKIDYVVLTHNHQDHILFETLLQIRHKVDTVILPNNQNGVLADPSLKLIFHRIGFKNIIALDDFEAVSFVGGEIIGLPFLGEHGDLNIKSKLTYYIYIDNKKFLFAADSNSIDEKLNEYIFERVGNIDILFLGMECDGAPLSWLYGPLLSKTINRAFDSSRTLSGSNFNSAWSLVKQSRCHQIYIYAMGQEPWLNYIMALKYDNDSIQIKESDKLIERCLRENILAERLFAKKELFI